MYPCAGVDADGNARPPFTLSYEQSATGKNLRTMTGHLAGDFDGGAEVTNALWKDCERANVQASSGSAGGNSGSSGQPKSVRLKFDRTLDTGMALKASAFALAGQSGASAPAVAGRGVRGRRLRGGADALPRARGRRDGDGELHAPAVASPACGTPQSGKQVADFSGR